MLSVGQLAVKAQVPLPLSIVAVAPEIEQIPVEPVSTVIVAIVEAFVAAFAVNVEPKRAEDGAVRLTVGLILTALIVWLRVAAL